MQLKASLLLAEDNGENSVANESVGEWTMKKADEENSCMLHPMNMTKVKL